MRRHLSDSKWLAVTSDWLLAATEVPESRSAWLFRADGSTPQGVRVFGDPTSTLRLAQSLGFSRDSQRLFVLGNFFSDVTTETTLLSTSDFQMAEQSAVPAEVDPVPAGGDIEGFTPGP